LAHARSGQLWAFTPSISIRAGVCISRGSRKCKPMTALSRRAARSTHSVRFLDTSWRGSFFCGLPIHKLEVVKADPFRRIWFCDLLGNKRRTSRSQDSAFQLGQHLSGIFTTSPGPEEPNISSKTACSLRSQRDLPACAHVGSIELAPDHESLRS
jgi:hypothetical protein